MTYVVKDECIKCKYTDCVAVCPVDCCVDDEDVRESVQDLLKKKDLLHLAE